MWSTMQPVQRVRGLLTRSVDGELIVYDLSSETVTHLDEAASTVWEACDGSRNLGEIAAAAGLAPDEAARELLRLGDANLLTAQGASRRAFLARAAGVAWAVPLVSIGAPAPAYAQSAPPTPTIEITGTCIGQSGKVGSISINLAGFQPGPVLVSYQVAPDIAQEQTQVTVAPDGRAFVATVAVLPSQPARSYLVTVDVESTPPVLLFANVSCSPFTVVPIPEPGTCERVTVGEMSHTCDARGCVNSVSIPVSGLPPNRAVILELNVLPPGSFKPQGTTDGLGSITFVQNLDCTTSPAAARNVLPTMVQVAVGEPGFPGGLRCPLDSGVYTARCLP